MPSEYSLDLCFIHDNFDMEQFHAVIEQEMERLSGKSGKWFAERKTEGTLTLSIVQVNGLTSYETEEEVKQQLESRMTSVCWEWLNGYRLVVTPKEEAGCCQLKRKPS